MTDKVYFSLHTPALGGKYFVAAFTEKTMIRGVQRLQKVDIAVTGAVMVTVSPTSQRTHSVPVLINGDEQSVFDPDFNLDYEFGGYDDLADYFKATSVTFTDWNGDSYKCIFLGSSLTPTFMSPLLYPMTVPITLVEKSEGVI